MAAQSLLVVAAALAIAVWPTRSLDPIRRLGDALLPPLAAAAGASGVAVLGWLYASGVSDVPEEALKRVATPIALSSPGDATKPDVYQIILDGLGRPDVLR
jgi:hypothetical protein